MRNIYTKFQSLCREVDFYSEETYGDHVWFGAQIWHDFIDIPSFQNFVLNYGQGTRHETKSSLLKILQQP